MSSGYAETLTEALPDPKRVKEEKARLESIGVKYIFSCWIDMLGIPKTNVLSYGIFLMAEKILESISEYFLSHLQ